LTIWYWGESHNEELYSLPNVIRMFKPRKMKCERHTLCMDKEINGYKVLVRKLEEKRPPVKPRHRWKDVKLYLKEIGLEGVD
jgi:hypothetical protein